MGSKSIVLVCAVVCAASAFARAEFASLAQAQAAFATDDPTGRERAYRYVLESVGSADGRDAFARLQVLRTMAGALGRVSEYDAVCERGLSSPDEAVRFASLMALALSPSAARAPEDAVSRLEGAARGGVALDTPHRSCADAALQPVLAVTRDPAVAKAVVDYLTYGPNGPDGAKGTADDLPDPLESLSDTLKLGTGC